MRDEGILACVRARDVRKILTVQIFFMFSVLFWWKSSFCVTFPPHRVTIAMFEIILTMREFFCWIFCFVLNKPDSNWAQNCRAKQIATQQITMSSNLKLYIFYDSISPSVDLVALQWMALLSELREFQQKTPDWNTVYYDFPSTWQLEWLSQLNSTCSRKCKGIWNLFASLCIAKAHIAEKSNCSTLCVWWNVFKCTCRCSFAYLLETTLDDMIWYDIVEGENTWLWLVHSHTQHCRHFFWFPYFQSFHPRQVYRRFACAQHAMFYDIEKWKKI